MTEAGYNRKDSAPSLLPQLPKLKGAESFSKFAALNIDDDKKDAIYNWWRAQPETEKELGQIKSEINKPTLPINERNHTESLLNKSLKLGVDISDKILGFLNEKPGIVKRVINIYASALGISGGENAANDTADLVEEFNDSQEELKLAKAVCAAVNETRNYNSDEKMIYKKVAQSSFDEMFNQLVHDRIVRKNDIDVESTSIIDSPKTEEIELKSTLSGEPWTGREREVALRKYNKLKRVMAKLETDAEYKIAFNTLWKWANGKIPQDASVFKILEYTENLYDGITDTLVDAWDYEVEKEEDSQEDDDE